MNRNFTRYLICGLFLIFLFSCSILNKKDKGLEKKFPLSNSHQLAGISCKGCHEDPATPEAADSGVCKKCHNDMDALYSATSDEPVNPHFSPHEGKVPDCSNCHHQHTVSENYCDNCHKRQ